MNYLENAFLYFFFYAVIGYLCEVTYVFIGTKKLVNRGFLYGPYIPIYGLGAFFVTTLLNEYNNDPVTIFILSMVICASLEYFISFLMEQIFHNRWWDYSNHKYNINGRVCLQNTLLFGIGSLGIIYLINPLYFSFITKLSTNTKRIIFLILFIIMLIDFILSFIEALKVNHLLPSLDKILNDSESKYHDKIRKIRTRLLMAYPYLVNNNFNLIQKLKKQKKEFSKKQKS